MSASACACPYYRTRQFPQQTPNPNKIFIRTKQLIFILLLESQRLRISVALNIFIMSALFESMTRRLRVLLLPLFPQICIHTLLDFNCNFI